MKLKLIFGGILFKKSQLNSKTKSPLFFFKSILVSLIIVIDNQSLFTQ